MQHLLDLATYPIDRPDSDECKALIERCRADLAAHGMYNLDGFLKPEVAQAAADDLKSTMASAGFTHSRMHNIYFKKDLPDLAPDHPALTRFQTVNHTLCADQLGASPVTEIYAWPPLVDFLAVTMGKRALFAMDDPLARINVMAYHEGETLNWHFDRSEFTTTLLLQAPEAGGDFEYRTDLRTADNPNYEGVARLLRNEDPDLRAITPTPGALNVFRGINTPHRVTRIRGNRERMIAVFSYYDKPGVTFSEEERIGFYGRSA
ncbi:MAG: 2OG-Fe(II) oxygenase [Boseongicola sp.]|nr:2OG-Fe(II) oxygenase [Boseongicola sp.]